MEIVTRNFITRLSEPDQRKLQKVIKEARQFRQADRQTYVETKGFLMSQVKQEIQWWKNQLGDEKPRFFDAGAGVGHAMRKAEDAGAEAHGTTLNPVDSRIREHFQDRLHDQLFEEMVVPDHFHVIQSHLGHVHAANLAVAFENLLNSLKPAEENRRGGSLWVNQLGHVTWQDGWEKLDHGVYQEYRHARDGRRQELEAYHPQLAFFRMLETLKGQGFGVPDAGKFFSENGKREFDKDFAFRISRGTGKADLSGFYDHPTLNWFPIKSENRRGTKTARMPRTYE